MADNKEEQKIHVQSYGYPGISIKGFTTEEYEKIMGSLWTGNYFIRVVNGRLDAVPVWEKLPDPKTDDKMLLFWREATDGQMSQVRLPFNEIIFDNNASLYSPIIDIQHLCGHYYTKEGYRENVEKLESYGFECLRSKRDNNGTFYEIWHLSLCLAKGELKIKILESIINLQDTGDQIADFKIKNEKKLNAALSFLREAVSFGTLDVSVQRLAMPNPD
ncbi:MAG: hypothetical protein WDK96_01035 [Candidatus Paceibacterota bacterium]|jgi:hypothetical protein